MKISHLKKIIKESIKEIARSNNQGGGSIHNTPENMRACRAAGVSDSECRQGLQTGTIPPGSTPTAKNGFWCCFFGMKCCWPPTWGDMPDNRSVDIDNESDWLKAEALYLYYSKK